MKLSPAQIAAIKQAGFMPLGGNCWVKFGYPYLFSNYEALLLLYDV